jgi:hypothetical protein
MLGKIVNNTVLNFHQLQVVNSPNLLNRDAIDVLSVDFSTLAGSTGICIRDLMKKMSAVPILLDA